MGRPLGASYKSRVPAILGGSPIFNKAIPITRPTIPSIATLKKKYERVLKSGMITNSKNVLEFESKLAEYLTVKHVVAVNSCTSGLMLSMKTLGLRGKVILPSFTFHATAHAAVWSGLRPVFVDCNPQTYNIDPAEVKKAITPNTSAIVGVHVFGNPADIDNLEKLAKKNRLRLIFDAAHAFGTKYKGKNVGSFGDVEVFSLSPTKLLTTGEGGIVATNDNELAKRIRVGRNYGDPGTHDSEFSGLNARMSEFHALLGIESLKKIETNVLKRNKIALLYKSLLAHLPGITFQKIHKANRSSFKDFSILIDRDAFGLNRDKLYDALMAENIVVEKYFYPPVHLQKAFKKFNNTDQYANTNYISENALSLPLFSHMSDAIVKKICVAINSIYANNTKIAKR